MGSNPATFPVKWSGVKVGKGPGLYRATPAKIREAAALSMGNFYKRVQSHYLQVWSQRVC